MTRTTGGILTNELDGYLNIVGGAGADVITGSGNADTFTLGGGTDTVTAMAHAGGKFVYDTITDIATGDVINTANQGTEIWKNTSAASSKIVLSDMAGFADYLDSASIGDGSVNGIYSWFVFSGNTYLVEDISAGASFTGGTDIVIKLSGILDLTSSAVGDHVVTLAVA